MRNVIKSKKELSESKFTKRQWAAAAVFALLAVALFISPTQAPVVLFKACLVTFAAVLAYWIDKLMQPQVDMGDLAEAMKSGDIGDRDNAVKLAQAVMIRRALITLAVVLGVCLGL